MSISSNSLATDLKELQPIYDSAKSFYNKAHYKKEQTEEQTTYNIYSYNVLVAKLEIIHNSDKCYNKLIKLHLDHTKKNEKKFYSRTTLRHIKELIKQATDPIRYDNEYDLLFIKNGWLASGSIELLRKATKKDLFDYARQIYL